MAANIQIRIDPDGTTHFEVSGVAGPSCETITEALIRATGSVKEKNLTEEYNIERPDYIQDFE